MSEVKAIGIDLGTTYSCVAVFRNDKTEIIRTDNGLTTMASFVSFTKYGRIIGDNAKENSMVNPTTTIFDVKRFIGRRYNDETLQKDLRDFPFDIVNVNENPKIKVNFKGKDQLFYPEEISAMILEKLKENAEHHLGDEVQKAVITVPAHFNDSQRQATKDAGRIAGLEVLRIINEPTAAALAYGIDKKYKGKTDPCNILVYDFGGGTFDVSVITIDDGIFEVKSTNGDTHLGGNDIDLRLVEHVANEFKKKFNKDLTADKRAIRRLRMQCEKLKQNLSSAYMAIIDIDNLFEDCDFYMTMTKNQFETICNDIFEKTLDFVRAALMDAKINVQDIDEVVLVGGSTRIPKVQNIVQNFFTGKKLNTSLNPDEAIAIGAAIQASILEGSDSDIIGGLLLMDVNPLSLGIEIVGGLMSTLIPRNTQIPVEKQDFYYNFYNNQKSVAIKVYEGERHNVSSNHLLGEFILEGLTPRKAGQTEILVTFNINTNGILHVTAVEHDKDKNNSKSISIIYDKSRLSDEEIYRLIKDAERLKRDDQIWAKSVKARIKLQSYCQDTLQRVQDLTAAMSLEHRQTVESKCNSMLKWIEENMDKGQEEYEFQHKEVFTVCNSIIKEYL